MTSEEQSLSPARCILSLSDDGSIIQYDKDCERAFGFSRTEVIRKNFLGLLSEDDTLVWEKVFAEIKRTLRIPEFLLSVHTRDGSLLPVRWSGFVLGDGAQPLQGICLIGHVQPAANVASCTVYAERSEKPAPLLSPGPARGPQEAEGMHDALRSLVAYLQELQHLMTHLTEGLSEQQHRLETLPEEVKAALDQHAATMRPSLPTPPPHELRQPLFGKGKRMAQDRLAAWERDLSSREDALTKEQELFEQRVEEFRRWKEKLKAAEQEIERRYRELPREEPQPPTVATDAPEQASEPDYEDLLQTLPQPAALVRQGIIKQVNAPFVALVGTEPSVLLETSFFDLVAREGLDGIETYYLDRLRGVRQDGFRTVLTTKGGATVAVSVAVTPMRRSTVKTDLFVFSVPATAAVPLPSPQEA